MLHTIQFKLPFHILQTTVTWNYDTQSGLSCDEQFFSPYMLYFNMNRLLADNGVGSGL